MSAARPPAGAQLPSPWPTGPGVGANARLPGGEARDVPARDLSSQ